MADKFFIVSELNGLVLDVEKGSTADSAKLITCYYHGGENQQFTFKANGEIASVKSGKGLNVQGGAIQGHRIIQWPSCGHAGELPFEYAQKTSPNQLWRIHKDGTIRLAGGNLCLDIQKGNMNNCASVVAWSHHGGANQRWRLVNKFE